MSVPKFGPKRINPGTGGTFNPLKDKGAKSEMLPSRHALNKLTKGDPVERSIGNYAKLTPVGVGALPTYQSIIDMGLLGIDGKPKGS